MTTTFFDLMPFTGTVVTDYGTLAFLLTPYLLIFFAHLLIAVNKVPLQTGYTTTIINPVVTPYQSLVVSAPDTENMDDTKMNIDDKEKQENPVLPPCDTEIKVEGLVEGIASLVRKKLS